MTHIPLARDSRVSCGPLRECSSTIHSGVGHGWQHTFSWDTTKFILSTVKPVSIFRQVVRPPDRCSQSQYATFFSGDDHDYCEMAHRVPNSDSVVSEFTVKAFTTNAGIRRPGFQLLTLVAPSPSTNEPAQQLNIPCFLPDQTGIHSWVYPPLVFLTVLGLLVANVYQKKYGNEREERVGTYPQPMTKEADEPSTVLDVEMGAKEVDEDFRTLIRAEDGIGHGDGAALLSAPASHISHAQRNRDLSWTVILGGIPRRISVPSSTVSITLWLFAIGGVSELGLLWVFMGDLIAVAWPPLGVFGGIAWWIFHT